MEGTTHTRSGRVYTAAAVEVRSPHSPPPNYSPHPLLLAPNTSTHNLHRSASRRSARSGVSTTPSRAQSLIKKSIELQDLKPADVLIERFVAWKAIVKQLTAYFEVRIILSVQWFAGWGWVDERRLVV